MGTEDPERIVQMFREQHEHGVQGSISEQQITRDLKLGKTIVVTAAEFRELPNCYKRIVDFVVDDTFTGTILMKPVVDQYEGTMYLKKIAYVEVSGEKSEPEIRAYSRDELITEMERVSDIVGRAPTTADMQEHADISMSPYYRVFGKIENALKAADLYPVKDES